MTATDPPSDSAPEPHGMPDAAEYTAMVEETLTGYLKQRSLPPSLKDAISYSLLAPGKRLRPVLVFRACEAVGGQKAAAKAPAAAIEMIHAFSLIHDDLPAMDDDDLRRGRPTLHKQTSEPMAILAGDALNTLAFEIIATKVADATLASGLIRELTVATNDMIAGQVYDTLPADGDNLDASAEALDEYDRLERIHRHKTGALLRCACRMGAMCGGASGEQLKALSDYADAIGLMFQVVDDLLDVTSDAETLGKATQKDEDAGKLTYPGLIGIEASHREVATLKAKADVALDRLVEALDNSKGDAIHSEERTERVAPLRHLAEFVANRKK